MAISDLPGFNRAKTSVTNYNVATTVAKGGGDTYEAGVLTPIARPDSFDGSTNDNAQAFFTNVTENSTPAISASGRNLGEPRDFKVSDSLSAGNVIQGDGNHDKLSDLQIVTTGLTETRTGTFIAPDGSTVSIKPSGEFDYQVIDGSGDEALSESFRYYWKQGGQNTEKVLPPRNL